ncbi:aminopeptidase P family protein [Clostridium algidicarnis]|uniref:aminopeptidase P family protein n=1 Tax=Clostridium algidicarnis TaxID=37659 RepID=UPI001C0B48A9|nr:aminopeptidase P family protein [Clostridium algidicarnis]MBU3210393.1 aminopeptidase P family protein [Clostridium algidicarnis]MBU3228365.1 aminopeptidase P family protein [Clostridium algidicarnis]MBU3251422.1 aminopeptidase P family protein [Clostridium algidicarnis]
MNKEVFNKNRERLSKELENNSVLIMFSGVAPKKSADEEYPFTPNRNFYYLTGINEEHVILLMVKQNNIVEEFLFIRRPNPVMEKWVGKTISDEKAKECSGVNNIKYTDEFESLIHEFIAIKNLCTVYMDLEKDAFNSMPNNVQNFAYKIKENYVQVNIKNIYNAIEKLRAIKSKEEVMQLRNAIDITKDGIESLMRNCKPGMKEYEIEAYFDFVLKTNGIKDYSFKTIAATGKNATVLHYVANDGELKDEDLILFDLGAQLNYYNADISRTFPVSGKFTERQKQIYNIVLKAELEVIKIIKPGVPFQELNKIAKRILADGLKEINIIDKDEDLSKYYFHGVSHHLGLDTHDVGSREGLLEPGMVITVEPGLYIEEEKIGIRIEDDILVTENGAEVLSKDIIKTVEEIEKFMAI